MKLDITGPARADIENLFDFMAKQNPRAAVATVDRILTALESLDAMPERGRPGRVAGTRELAIPRTRYIAIYRVNADSVVVSRVLHNQQDRSIE